MLMIAAAFIVLLAIMVFTVGLVGSQRGQKAIYYAVRREAHRTATRIYAWSLWCLGLAVALFIASRVLPSENLPSQNAATLARITSTDSAKEATARLPTETIAPTARPVFANTTPSTSDPSTGLPTVTLLPTFTPAPAILTPTLDIIQIEPITATPLPVATSLPTTTNQQPLVMSSNKPLNLRAVSSQIGAESQPINNSTQFTNGISTIYVIFDFHDIPRGTVLRHTWLRNGVSVSFSSAPFNRLGLGTDNVSWTPKGGFIPGLYEVRVALANTPQFTANFLVR